MAKYFTRTITIYTYTTGTVNLKKMKVENAQDHVYPYKLGAKARRELERAEQAPILSETTSEALYSMSLEDFLKYAKPVTDNTDDTENQEADNAEA